MDSVLPPVSCIYRSHSLFCHTVHALFKFMLLKEKIVVGSVFQGKIWYVTQVRMSMLNKAGYQNQFHYIAP